MKYILPLMFLFFSNSILAQLPADTAVEPLPKPKTTKLFKIKKDTAVQKRQVIADTAKTPANKPAGSQPSTLAEYVQTRRSYRATLKQHPYFNFFGQPQNLVAEERPDAGKEAFFYLMAGLLFFFALVKLLFNKYVNNLLGLVFRGSLRQKQIREQLLQTPLPSLFLNVFFVIVAGLYLLFLLQYYHRAPKASFWLLLLYCVVAVGLVYLVKFVVLKLTGWIFNMRDAADTYIFIVFLVNKLLAIFLLPLLIVMVFSVSAWGNVLLTLSYIMVALFIGYRYIASFAPVRREVKVSQFHFFMYLCAFEIVPLLLIYKVLVHFS